jgi:hypothetical protein
MIEENDDRGVWISFDVDMRLRIQMSDQIICAIKIIRSLNL